MNAPVAGAPPDRTAAILGWTGLVVADVAAQLLFKTAAIDLPPPQASTAWVAIVAQSPLAWAAVACLLVAFGFWMRILRRAKLATAFPVTALAFVGVVAGSHLLFGETVSFAQGAGIVLIVAGVALLRPLDA